MESKHLDASIEDMRTARGLESRGQILGAILVVIALLIGTYLVVNGFSWPGYILFGSAIGGILGAYMFTRKTKTINTPTEE